MTTIADVAAGTTTLVEFAREKKIGIAKAQSKLDAYLDEYLPDPLELPIEDEIDDVDDEDVISDEEWDAMAIPADVLQGIANRNGLTYDTVVSGFTNGHLKR